jgi:acetolactate synthase I/II/III large subunit
VSRRRVLCLNADSSGMFTLQALWTMARRGLRSVLLFSSTAAMRFRSEFSYLGVGEPGPRASSMFDIGHPDLDWIHLAKGMGSPADATSLEGFAKLVRKGFESEGPSLTEVPL